MVSNLNFESGRTVANIVLARVDPGGGTTLANPHRTLDVNVDIVACCDEARTGDAPALPSLRFPDTGPLCRVPGAGCQGDGERMERRWTSGRTRRSVKSGV